MQGDRARVYQMFFCSLNKSLTECMEQCANFEGDDLCLAVRVHAIFSKAISSAFESETIDIDKKD